MSFASRIRGFTLVEILIVVGLVALLAGIALPAMRATRESTVAMRARTELALMAQALEDYRRLYGDYPQTGDFAQAAADPAQPLLAAHAQAKLFNALAGVFGPRAFGADDRINGRTFVEVGRFLLEFPVPGNFSVPMGSPPRKAEVRTSLLDPWGRRYLYYYKSADNPSAWKTAGYRLYSAGPDGRHAPPGALSGIEPRDAEAVLLNADNVEAGVSIP